MKLKYILPVATIASVAAAVTPLATSCSCSGKWISWDYVKDGKYQHELEKVSSDFIPKDMDELGDKYFEIISKDKSNFAYDNLLSMNKRIEGTQPEDIKALKNSIQVTDVLKDEQRLSLKNKFTFNHSESGGFVEATFDITIKKIKMGFEYVDSLMWTRGWNVGVKYIMESGSSFIDPFSNDVSWSISGHGKIIYTPATGEEPTMNIDNDINFDHTNIKDIDPGTHPENQNLFLLFSYSLNMIGQMSSYILEDVQNIPA